PAGAVLGGDRDDPVSPARALCGPPGLRLAAIDDGERRASDRAPPDPERRDHGGPGRADHAARLRAGRVRRRRYGSGGRGDAVVGVLAPVPGDQPALLAHVLLAPAAVG